MTSLSFLNSTKTQLSYTDNSNTVWTGLTCSVDSNNVVTILGDGQIPNEAKALLEKGVVPIAFTPPPITPSQVQAERIRRLGLGFSYDFKDVRGVHVIGTTPADMLGWDDVDKSVNALVTLGLISQTFDIVTNTGRATITPVDWAKITLGATAFRTPIWFASFTLEATPVIPQDYTADKYWV